MEGKAMKQILFSQSILHCSFLLFFILFFILIIYIYIYYCYFKLAVEDKRKLSFPEHFKIIKKKKKKILLELCLSISWKSQHLVIWINQQTGVALGFLFRRVNKKYKLYKI